MKENNPTEENKTRNIKLYSSKAITGSTLLGGPLVAGYLIGENFKALGKPEQAKNSLIIGIVVTFIVFTGLFMLPENVADRIPNQLLPLVFTGIVLLIIDRTQNDTLRSHKEHGNQFYSGWRAAGFGLVSLVIIVIGIFGYAYLSTPDYGILEMYDEELAIFSTNETETLVFYEDLDSKNKTALLDDLDNWIIPKWKKNLEIIERTSQFQDLPEELSQQNILLKKYCILRIEAFSLFRKAISEETEEYAPELERIHKEIQIQIDKLNSI